MGIVAVRFDERPALWDELPDIGAEVWPEYNRHGDILNRYWPHLEREFGAFQFALYDEETGEVLAEGHTAPCPWDGSAQGLGEGIDEMIVAAFEARARGRRPTALCALAAEVRPRFQGQGLAARMLREMAALARAHGFAHLIAPVRPSLKERYPLAAIERYLTWRTPDGKRFDPWLRVHERVGGRIARPAPRSMRITGTVAEWQLWTGMEFPDAGRYTFPAGLAPVSIDRRTDRGVYWEPNVWVVHPIGM
jgi:GNAT superfamily N-acetyltransferase